MRGACDRPSVMLRDFDLADMPNVEIKLVVADRAAPLNMEDLPEPACWYVESERRILLRSPRRLPR